jgi:hypothetical protein
MPKHAYKPGDRVSYTKLNHRFQQVNYMHVVVERVSTNRVIVRDGFGRLHYVKPINLASLKKGQ